MLIPPPFVRAAIVVTRGLAALLGLATAGALPAAPQFSLAQVWNPANSDIDGNPANGPEAHFVYGIGVDWRDHVLVACEGRFNHSAANPDSGEKKLLVRISRDHGVTWGGDYVVEGGDGRSWTNPSFLIDGTATYLFYSGTLPPNTRGKQLFCRQISETWNAATQQWEVTIGARAELTSLWSLPGGGTLHDWFVNSPLGHGIKKLKEPNRGRVILPVAHRTADTSTWATTLYGVDMVFKDPGGNWTRGTTSETPLAQETDSDPYNDVGAGECRVAEGADGSLMLFTRKGVNFLPTAAHPELRSRMRIAGTSQANSITWNDWINADGIGGTLKVDGGFIRFSDTCHIFAFSNNDGHSDRLNMAVRVSGDGGITWSNPPRTLYGDTWSIWRQRTGSVTWPGSPATLSGGTRHANYCDLARDSLGNVFCVFGSDGDNHNLSLDDNPNHITSSVTVAKFNVEWLTGVVTPTLVVDNGDAGFSTTGAWSPAASSIDGYYGSNYATASATATATWTPTITVAGNYEIYIRWTAHANRCPAAPVTIVAAGGSTTTDTTIDQRTEGGSWYYLGTYPLAAGTGNSVKIATTDTGYVVADAVMFQKQ